MNNNRDHIIIKQIGQLGTFKLIPVLKITKKKKKIE